MYEKIRLFERCGVREYWIVDPGNEYVQMFNLQSDGKEAGTYDAGTLIPPADWREEETIVKSSVLKGFQIDTKELFTST